MRGPPNPDNIYELLQGITPACAGTTSYRRPLMIFFMDHPRMCGDHSFRSHLNWLKQGSPPHVRGPLMVLLFHHTGLRITPACAGTTEEDEEVTVEDWDHPRMCGDHVCVSIDILVIRGSPPHVRGPPSILSVISMSAGITPACAGTTTTAMFNTGMYRDHPRMCGDHLSLSNRH